MRTKEMKPNAKSKKHIAAPGKYELRLYIAGRTSAALTAIKNLKSLCKGQLNGKYDFEVIDLLKNPGLCRRDQIFAIPTLIRKFPSCRKIIGDLSDTKRVISALNFKGN